MAGAARAESRPDPPANLFEASSVNGASANLLDMAGLDGAGERCGISGSQRLREGPSDEAITIALAGSGWVRARERRATERDPWPGPPRWLRRFTARVTLGGPLQFIDPGRRTPPDAITHHVTSELDWKLWEGRPTRPGTGNFPQLAVALVSDNLGTGYGLDRYGATFVFRREGPWALTANAGGRFEERYRSPTRFEELRLGSGVEHEIGRMAPFGGEWFVRLEGACLARNDDRPPVWQGGAGLGLQVHHGVTTWLRVKDSSAPEIAGAATRDLALGVGMPLR